MSFLIEGPGFPNVRVTLVNDAYLGWHAVLLFFAHQLRAGIPHRDKSKANEKRNKVKREGVGRKRIGRYELNLPCSSHSNRLSVDLETCA